jgi:hypothetical protein
MSDDAERNAAISHDERGYRTLRFDTPGRWLSLADPAPLRGLV